MTDYAQSRTRMVDNQLRTNDVTDHRILDAMQSIPRERFVPASKRAIAYIDEDLPVGAEETGRFLMKPHIFGKLVQLAHIGSDDVVLIVGAGTGYSSAVIAKLAASVVALEEDALDRLDYLAWVNPCDLEARDSHEHKPAQFPAPARGSQDILCENPR